MASEFIVDNAIGWAHLQLRGGWKNVLTTSIAYAVLISGLIIVTERFDPQHASTVLRFWVSGLLGLQVAMLLGFGCLTIGTALRLDLSTGIIESHRMMPVPAIAAISGYITGAASQAIALAAANFLIGTIVSKAAGVELMRWIVPNGILLAFAIFVWVTVVFMGFVAPAAFRWLSTSLIFGGFMSKGFIFTLLPGIMVLLSPLTGNSIFAMRTADTEFGWGPLVSLAGQAFIGAIFYVGAMRKYRRGDALSLNAWQGLLLLLGWVAISAVGVTHWDEFEPSYYSDMMGPMARFIATIVLAMVLALVPVAAAAWMDAAWHRSRELHDPELERRPVPPALTIVLAVAIVLPFCWTLNDRPVSMQTAVVRTGIVIASFLIGVSFVLRSRYRGEKKAAMIAVAWVLLTWAGPIVVDLARHGLSGDLDDQATTEISLCSPVMSLLHIWTSGARRALNPTPGLIVQALFAGIPLIWFYTMRPRAKAMN